MVVMAITSDRGNAYKVGDGSSEWNDLSYNTAIAQDVYRGRNKKGKPKLYKNLKGWYLVMLIIKADEQIRAD